MTDEIPLHRVLMTGDTVGGVWTYALELAEALGHHGVEVILAALGGPPTPDQRCDAQRIPNLHLLESDFKLEWMDDPWDDLERSGNWLLELEELFAPDVVHLNSYGHGALDWRSPVVLTGHSCVMSWWTAVKREPAPPSWTRYRFEVACSLQAADLVVAPSRAMLSCLEGNYGVPVQGRVVPNGRDPARFRRAAKQAFILTAGRLWDEAKNTALLARIAPSLPWPVCVAGEVRHPNGASPALDGCRVLGRLSHGELRDCYARAAIYALPARYEPFGLSALEAALSGCALVLGDIASLREIWQDAAVFVPPDDSFAWERELRALMADPARVADLALRGLERAQQFTPQRMAEGYMAAYAEARRECLCGS